jgi:hypothetical protein
MALVAAAVLALVLALSGAFGPAPAAPVSGPVAVDVR